MTGPDGDSVSTERLVSRLRGVVLNPENWNMCIRPSMSQLGARIFWKAQVRSVDIYQPKPLRGGGFESSINLINDLPYGSHILQLVTEDPTNAPAIAALRIYPSGGGVPFPNSMEQDRFGFVCFSRELPCFRCGLLVTKRLSPNSGHQPAGALGL